MENFLGLICAGSFMASVVVAAESGGAVMQLVLAGVLGVSTTVAAAGLAITKAIRKGMDARPAEAERHE